MLSRDRGRRNVLCVRLALRLSGINDRYFVKLREIYLDLNSRAILILMLKQQDMRVRVRAIRKKMAESCRAVLDNVMNTRLCKWQNISYHFE
jgi:hypothetical protein